MQHRAHTNNGGTSDEPFHKRFKRLRLLQGLTLDQVGAAVGVTKPAVFRWEAGSSVPRREYLSTLADLMKVSIPELMLGEVRAAEALQPKTSDGSQTMAIIADCKQRIARSMGIDADCVDVIIRA